MVGATALFGLSAGLVLAPLSDRPPPIQPIYGGELVAEGEWPGVVAIDLGSLLCTGTLVAPNLVLTAAHCLKTSPPPSSVKVRFGAQAVISGVEITAASYKIHPDYCDEAVTCGKDCWDFAYIVLESPADAAYPPVGILSSQEDWDEWMRVGTPVSLVGYGRDEQGTMGFKRIAETVMTAFGATGLEFEAGGMGIDSCQGDSGGPAFVVDGQGAPILVGVLSRGYDCGEGGCYGIPESVLCWVSDESGIDIRPAGCPSCGCLETAADSGGCDACAIDRPRSVDAAALLAPLLVLFARRRRRRRGAAA
ncbi:MAG: trypsin-like serine protease [Nannocystaceae bacterium]